MRKKYNINKGKLPLSQGVKSVFQRNTRFENPGLVFNKFINEWRVLENGGRILTEWSLKVTVQRKTGSQLFLEKIVRKFKSTNGGTKKLWEETMRKRDLFIERLKNQGYEVKSFLASTQWRFVTGLGMAHVLETGFLFDRNTGVPFISGSSIKGAARAFAKLNGLDKDLIEIFGPEGDEAKKNPSQGKVVFFDAYPAQWPSLKVDIMNVHYKEYYEDKAPPADYLSPVPIYFLTVAPDTKFKFYLAVKGIQYKSFLKKTEQLLKGALEDIGIGAKTAVGYGYFNP